MPSHLKNRRGRPTATVPPYNTNMRVSLPVLIVLATAAAHAQHLAFTTVTHLSCPVWIEAPLESKDYGFQSVKLRNDSDRTLQKVYLTVTFFTGKQPE